MPERLLVGVEAASIKLPVGPDNRCFKYGDWMPTDGDVVLALNRPAPELDRPVSGIIRVRDEDLRDTRIVLHGGGCPNISERCFSIPPGETRVALKARMACGDDEVMLGDVFTFTIQPDVQPLGLVAADPARNNVRVTIGDPIPALPLGASFLLALLLAVAARRGVIRRGHAARHYTRSSPPPGSPVRLPQARWLGGRRPRGRVRAAQRVRVEDGGEGSGRRCRPGGGA